MIVCNPVDFIGQFDQLEIVSRNQTHRRSLRERTYVRSASNQTFTTVCAAEDFIDQKQHRQSVVHLRRRQQRLQTFYFSVKIREPVLHRVAYLDTREQTK